MLKTYQRIGILIWQWLDQHTVDHAENCNGRAYAKHKHQAGNECERRCAPEYSYAMAQISDGVCKKRRTLFVPCLVFQCTSSAGFNRFRKSKIFSIKADLVRVKIHGRPCTKESKHA